MIKFPPHKLANKYLANLKGVEVGGSKHNEFGLDTINVDNTDQMTVYKQHEIELCGEYMKVDVVADASKLPFPDKSYDFVISSHMLEHTYDPIATIEEWVRVAKKYIFIIVPRKDLTFDKDKPVTKLDELLKRNYGIAPRPYGSPSDDHWSIWDVEQWKIFCKAMESMFGLKIVEFEEKDTKVGNGMMVLFEVL